jgi:hypothetical protein
MRLTAPSPSSRRRGVLGTGFAVLALAAALFSIATATASATVLHLANGTSVGYQPVQGAGPVQPNGSANPFNEAEEQAKFPLLFHGGPVMTSNSNYVILWAPKKGPKYAPKYTSGIAKYFKDLAHDSGLSTNVDSVAAQYGAPYSSSYAGSIKDSDPYPANGCTRAAICLTDAQLATEIAHVVQSKGLPADLKHEYFMVTPEGVESCFEASGHVCSANSSVPAYCAYHSDITVAGGTIVYANDPYVYGKNCDEPADHPNGPSDAALLGGLSHEHNESITDPELNAWYDAHGEENGDKCRTFESSSEFGTILGTAPDGSPYNQLINKHRYFYQQEWSNSGLICKQHA